MPAVIAGREEGGGSSQPQRLCNQAVLGGMDGDAGANPSSVGKRKPNKTESRQGGNTQKGRMILPEPSWPEGGAPASLLSCRRDHRHGLTPPPSPPLPLGTWGPSSPWPLAFQWPSAAQSPGPSLEPCLRGDGSPVPHESKTTQSCTGLMSISTTAMGLCADLGHWPVGRAGPADAASGAGRRTPPTTTGSKGLGADSG